MDLSEIIAITGKPGLYKVLGQTKSGVIVESLEDGKRFPVFSAYQVSALDEISIYTEEEEMPLGDVMQKIHDKQDGKQAIDHNSKPDQLKTFFGEALPDYDKDRVYTSDIKKVLRWYNVLQKEGFFKKAKKKKEETKEQEGEDKKEEKKAETKAAKDTKKPAAKKKAPAKKKPAAKKKKED